MPTTREKSAKVVEETESFLKSGGKITEIPRGVTGITGPKTMRRAIATQADKKRALKNGE